MGRHNQKSISLFLALSLSVDWLSAAALPNHSIPPVSANPARVIFDRQALLPPLAFAWHGLNQWSARVKQWVSGSTRVTPDSLALAGRHGFNELTWPKKPTPVDPNDAQLAWLWGGIPTEDAEHLLAEINRQGIVLFTTEDSQGAFMRRRGNQILINSARQNLTARTRETALLHEVIGHDWEAVQKLLKAEEFDPADADLYEAYAMAVAEFAHLSPRRTRIQAVLNAFDTLAKLEDSAPNTETPSLGSHFSNGMSNHRRSKIMETLEALFPEDSTEQNDEDVWTRFRAHLTTLASMEMVPHWSSSSDYWATTLVGGDVSDSRWWVRLGWQWAQRAAFTRDLATYQAQIRLILGALDQFRSAPAQDNPRKSVRILLSYRLRLLVLESNDSPAKIRDVLSDFAAHYPELKPAFDVAIGKINQRAAALAERGSYDYSSRTFIELALQDIGVFPSYEEAAALELEKRAAELFRGGSVAEEMKSPEAWVQGLRFQGLSQEPLIQAARPIAEAMAAMATRSRDARDFASRAKPYFAALARSKKGIPLDPSQDDREIVKNLLGLLSLLIEYRPGPVQENLGSLEDEAIDMAPNLAKQIKALVQELEKSLKPLPATQAELAEKIRSALGLESPETILSYIDTLKPSQKAPFDRGSIDRSLSPVQRGEKLLEAYLQEVMEGRESLQEARFESSWREFFEDIEALRAVVSLIRLHQDAAQKSRTRQEFAQAVKEARVSIEILNSSPSTPPSTQGEAWEYARQLVRAKLVILRAAHQWDDQAHPFPTMDYWKKFLAGYRAHLGEEFHVEQFLSIEVRLPLSTRKQLHYAVMTPFEPGKGLDPQEYATILERSFDRPSLTEPGLSDRQRGLKALTELAGRFSLGSETNETRVNPQDVRGFAFSDVDAWIYAMKDPEAFGAIRKDLLLLSGASSDSSRLRSNVTGLVKAAEVLDNPQNHKPEDIIEAHLFYAFLDNTGATELVAKLKDRLGPLADAGPYNGYLETITAAMRKSTPKNALGAHALALQALGIGPTYPERAFMFFSDFVAGLQNLDLNQWPDLATEVPWLAALGKSSPDPLLRDSAEPLARLLGVVMNRRSPRNPEEALTEFQTIFNAWEKAVLSRNTQTDQEAVLVRAEAMLSLIPFAPKNYREKDPDHAFRVTSEWIALMPEQVRSEVEKVRDRMFSGVVKENLPTDATLTFAFRTLTGLRTGGATPADGDQAKNAETILQGLLLQISQEPSRIKEASRREFWMTAFPDMETFQSVLPKINRYIAAATQANKTQDPSAYFAAAVEDMATFDRILENTAVGTSPEIRAEEIVRARIGLMRFEAPSDPKAVIESLKRAMDQRGIALDIQTALFDRLKSSAEGVRDALQNWHQTLTNDERSSISLSLSTNDFIAILRQELEMDAPFRIQALNLLQTRLADLVVKPGALPESFHWLPSGTERLLRAIAKPHLDLIDLALYRAKRANTDRTLLRQELDSLLAALWLLETPSREMNPEERAREILNAALTRMLYMRVESRPLSPVSVGDRAKAVKQYLAETFPELKEPLYQLWDQAMVGYSGPAAAVDIAAHIRSQLGFSEITAETWNSLSTPASNKPRKGFIATPLLYFLGTLGLALIGVPVIINGLDASSLSDLSLFYSGFLPFLSLASPSDRPDESEPAAKLGGDAYTPEQRTLHRRGLVGGRIGQDPRSPDHPGLAKKFKGRLDEAARARRGYPPRNRQGLTLGSSLLWLTGFGVLMLALPTGNLSWIIGSASALALLTLKETSLHRTLAETWRRRTTPGLYRNTHALLQAA